MAELTRLTGTYIRSGSIPTTALSGGVVSSSVQIISALPTGAISSSTQVNYGELQNIPTDIVSSSAQVTAFLPTGTVSSSTQLPSGIASSSAQVTAYLPTDTVSSSAQVTTFLPNGTVSSSGQVNVFNTIGGPTLAITGSNTFTAPQTISDTTNSTSYLDGALHIAGGISVRKDIRVSGSMTINGLLTVVSMSSQYVTSSQYNLGVSKVTVNDDDNVRFAGLSVYDSGSSSPATASIYWDSLKHKFIYENLSGSSYNSALFIAGPKNTGSLGDETGLTVGYLPYATGGDHIDNSVMFQSSSNIGIGNTTPKTRLDVTGMWLNPTGVPTAGTIGSASMYVTNADYNYGIIMGVLNVGTGWIQTQRTDETAITYPLLLNPNGGNVGIGLTNPSYKLDVSGSAIRSFQQLLTGAGSDSIAVGPNIYFEDTSVAATATALQQGASGLFSIWTYDSVWGQRLNITKAGNVGIGTTTPSQSLHVVGDSRFATTTTSHTMYFGTDTGVYLRRDNTYDLVLAQHESSANPLYLVGAGNVIVSIDSNNNQNDGKFIIGNNEIKATNELFYVNESGNGYFSGSVGIGTSSNLFGKLNIADSTNGRMEFTPIADGVAIEVLNSGRTNAADFGIYGKNILFNTKDGGSYTERLRINAAGNVGIGTTNPTTDSKLDVNGILVARNGLVVGTNPISTDRYVYVSGDTGTTGTVQFGVVFNATLPNTATNSVFGLYTNLNIASGATMTNAYGLYVDTLTAPSSTITNKFGIYVADPNKNYFAGNVGIGSSNPSVKLDVNGGAIVRSGLVVKYSNNTGEIDTAYAPLLVNGPSANTITFDEETTTATLVLRGYQDNVSLQLGTGGNQLGTYAGWIQASYDNGMSGTGFEPLLLNPSGGDVGIGVTNPVNKLQIGATASGYAGNDLVIGNGTEVMAFYNYSGGPSTWFTNTNFALLKSGAGSTGNVGIGTSGPNKKLHIVGGDILVTGNSVSIDNNSGLRIVAPIATTHYNWMLGAQQNVGGTFEITPSTTTGSATFSTPTAVFTADGKVGIGTATPSLGKLELYGSANSYIIYADPTRFDSRAVLLPGVFFIGTAGGNYPEIGYNFNAFNSIYTKINNDTAWKINFGNNNRMDFAFAASGTGTISAWSNHVSILSTGLVGIGTTNPGAKLDVAGVALIGDTVSGAYVTPSKLHIASSGGTAQMSLEDVGTSTAGIALDGNNVSFGHQNSAVTYYFRYSNTYNGDYANTGTIIAAINSGTSYFNSNVGIGTTDPGSYKLRVQGDQYISGTLTEASSIALKENINPITDALTIISNLRGYTYDRKDGTTKNQAGLIAEEVERTLPNVISYDSEGNPSGVQYTKIIAYLVESIKQLKSELDSLRQ